MSRIVGTRLLLHCCCIAVALLNPLVQSCAHKCSLFGLRYTIKRRHEMVVLSLMLLLALLLLLDCLINIPSFSFSSIFLCFFK